MSTATMTTTTTTTTTTTRRFANPTLNLKLETSNIPSNFNNNNNTTSLLDHKHNKNANNKHIHKRSATISISAPTAVTSTGSTFNFNVAPPLPTASASSLMTPVSATCPRPGVPGVHKLSNELRKGYVSVPQLESFSSSSARSTSTSSNSSTSSAPVSLIVPTIVHKCCEFLLADEPHEGIFRINGSVKKIKMIEEKIDTVGAVNFNFHDCKLHLEATSTTPEEDTEPNAYDVAMILKRWLSNLDQGLVSDDVHRLLKDEYLNLNQEPNEGLGAYLNRYLNESGSGCENETHEDDNGLPTPASSAKSNSGSSIDSHDHEETRSHSMLDGDYSNLLC
ncbi:unnamed protein product [Ambrosiozyma monospora]|uniref:Unnamed protein product n=1 Tax=Ambrosiozyma monospora TaxID=43982 RepID=A0ACB5TGB4_AMBMO|nr:unnamed protein product [Ambrosiozyma monospora]